MLVLCNVVGGVAPLSARIQCREFSLSSFCQFRGDDDDDDGFCCFMLCCILLFLDCRGANVILELLECNKSRIISKQEAASACNLVLLSL